MKRKTTAGEVGGSITTVVPSIIAEVLDIKKGDKLQWKLDPTTKEVSLQKEE